ncbi:MAG: fibronectin type III domain-containing protein, partial [Verrucomicrobiaceae bacterium]|nr:fibronectin type III domain-containing protein [Verrucomicrobiaceae bacterium]
SVSLGQVPWNLNSYDLFYYLHPGKTYEVKIQSFRYNGNFGSSPTASGYSAPVTIVVPGTINNAPSAVATNLSVAAFVGNSVNQFGLYWDDNAADETGYEIQEKLGGGPDTGYVSLGVLGGVTGTNLGIGLPLANSYETGGARDFRIRTVRGNGPFAIVSGFSTAAGADMESFNPPTDLRLSAPADNGRVMLFWNDNATTETGYDIEYRVAGVGAFTVLGQLPGSNYSRLQDSGGVGFFPPSTLVEFRVRAYKTGSTTAYATASLTMPPMTAPTNLAQGAAGAEGTLNLTWTDNSGNELGYSVEARKTAPGTPDTEFATLLFTNANVVTAALTTTHLIPGYSYEFRVRAVNQVSQSSPLIFSNPSNLITRTSPFNAPTNLREQSGTLGETSVTLNWNDNSTIEHGFLVYSRPGGTTGTPVLIGATAANTTTATVGLTPGISTEFFVAAYVSLNPSGESVTGQSNGLTVTGRDVMTSPIYLELHQNEVMAPFTLTTTTGSTVSTRNISSLPAGLSFNSTTGQITGTPTGTGVTTSPVQVVFANGWT